MWLKTIYGSHFLTETHLTILPMIEKLKIDGSNFERLLNYQNLSKWKVCGTIEICERQKLFYQIKKLIKKKQKTNVCSNVKFEMFTALESRIFR